MGFGGGSKEVEVELGCIVGRWSLEFSLCSGSYGFVVGSYCWVWVWYGCNVNVMSRCGFVVGIIFFVILGSGICGEYGFL